MIFLFSNKWGEGGEVERSTGLLLSDSPRYSLVDHLYDLASIGTGGSIRGWCRVDLVHIFTRLKSWNHFYWGGKEVDEMGRSRWLDKASGWGMFWPPFFEPPGRTAPTSQQLTIGSTEEETRWKAPRVDIANATNGKVNERISGWRVALKRKTKKCFGKWVGVALVGGDTRSGWINKTFHNLMEQFPSGAPPQTHDFRQKFFCVKNFHIFNS